LAVIVGLAAASLPAAAGEAPAEFIRILGEQALAVMRSNAPAAQKEAYFHQMLHQDFDLDEISRFVLGPYWRVASAEQRQQFRSLLENYIMRSDGARLAQYGGGQLDVTGSRTDPAGVIVTSQVIRLGGRSIEMDWQLAMSGRFYKIEDVTIDGVSMALTHRSEIASMIARNGGRLEALLATMRQES
jgi:phospholipid transport system substrate-binding protein